MRSSLPRVAPLILATALTTAGTPCALARQMDGAAPATAVVSVTDSQARLPAAVASASPGAAARAVAALAPAASPTAAPDYSQANPAALPPAASPAPTPVPPPSSGTVAREAADPWRDSIAAFVAADRARPPRPGGVLFVGSSSIRLWDSLETEFEALPVVTRRGFGGSRMADCTRHLKQLVAPHKPRLVLVYAGDNDLAEGRSPAQVLESFAAFVEGVREELPATRIAFISIKPSPLRAALMPAAEATNALIRAYTQATPNTDYIDIYSAMLGPEGRPRPELFREDALHLNTQGYALWKRIIASHLN